VKNRVVPDPFYGLGNETIFDIAHSGREYYTFWFFTSFQCKLVRIILLSLIKFEYLSQFFWAVNLSELNSNMMLSGLIILFLEFDGECLYS